MDSTNQPEELTVPQSPQLVDAESPAEQDLNRRTALKRMMLGAIGVAASSSLSACLGDGTPQSLTFNPSSVGGTSGSGTSSSTSSLGTIDNPYTQANPGDYSTGKARRQVALFSSQVNASTSTPIYGLWAEVMDPSTAVAIIGASNKSTHLTKFNVFSEETLHPMTSSEYVSEIRITDATTGATLAAGNFAAGEAPRLIFDRSLTGITRINAYARIDGAGGWWMSTYEVSTLTYKHSTTSTDEVYGSVRQPLTRNQSGKFAGAQNKVYGHTGSVKISNQTHENSVTTNTTAQEKVRVIFGDHDAVRTHGFWTSVHYFVGAYLLDQRGQLITNATYTWGSGETGTTTGGIILELKSGSGASAGAAGTGSAAASSTYNSQFGTMGANNIPYTKSTSTSTGSFNGAPYLDLELPDYVTDFRLIWLCNVDGWWHIRGNTALIAG